MTVKEFEKNEYYAHKEYYYYQYAVSHKATIENVEKYNFYKTEYEKYQKIREKALQMFIEML